MIDFKQIDVDQKSADSIERMKAHLLLTWPIGSPGRTIEIQKDPSLIFRMARAWWAHRRWYQRNKHLLNDRRYEFVWRRK